MCGICGIVGISASSGLVLEGLKRLEYRGYDSAGIAIVNNGTIHRLRAAGKISNLEALHKANPLLGSAAIGHTRWATHGTPTETNAHPHATDKVAVVHNGIIENFRELREELQTLGYQFTSQTDTEVVPILITHYLDQGLTPAKATSKALKKLQGAFALGIIFAQEPDLMIAARRGSPLAIGVGEKENYLGSDAVALAPYTQRIIYLEDGDWAEIHARKIIIHDEHDDIVKRDIKLTSLSGAAIEKGNHKHYMQKEIFEQPGAIAQTLGVFTSHSDGRVHLPALPFDLRNIAKITLVACGTSYYAGMVARYWLERYARVAVELDIASEFRYRQPVMEKGGLAIFISQSGETADTLAALRLAKALGQHCLAIINAPESTMAQEAHAVLHTYAGPEIGVASTKAFTTQLTTLACFTLALAQSRDTLKTDELKRLTHLLEELPSRVAAMLHHDAQVAAIANQLLQARDVLYIGRGTSYAIAMEGALKLKEISYIHAEGYAAGEMKHGPIALIDEHVPVIVIAPSDTWFDKTASNTQEAVARGAKVILISDRKGIAALRDIASSTIEVPMVDDFVMPILCALPVQMLAYHVAVLKGADVDQPRNLAKSVTVE